jgi:phage baseplate assembly protein W
MTRATITFSDLDAGFALNPRTRDVARRIDDAAIKGALRNLIHTRHYERPFAPELGCQIHSMLFENADPLTLLVAERTIRDVIQKFEPRVDLLEVSVRGTDANDLTINVVYKIRNTDQVSEFTTQFTRVR